MEAIVEPELSLILPSFVTVEPASEINAASVVTAPWRFSNVPLSFPSVPSVFNNKVWR